jgi:putative ABC transport system permease protein
MWHDLRYGFRLLVAKPAFTGIAILTLAIGIGANTAILSAVTALLVRPLPIEDPDRLVFGLSMREGWDPFGTALLEYAAMRESSTFASSGVANFGAVTLVGHDEPERLAAASVSAGYFATLGTRPIAGRSIAPEDDRPGAPRVVLIGHELWQHRFGGCPQVLGEKLELDTGIFTIIGVMPRGFDMPGGARLWLPLRLNIDTASKDERAPRSYEFVARLASGVGLSAANADVARIARRIEDDYSLTRRGWSYHLVTLRQQLLGDLAGRNRLALLTLEAAVGFLLLICCADVASLLLVRGVAREREIVVRLALGAGRRDVLALVMRQGAAMIAFGLLAGIIVARALSLVLAGTLYGVSPNDPLTFATVVVVLATVSVAACYLPARRATRVDPLLALRAE